MFLKVELTVCAEGWNARCKRKEKWRMTPEQVKGQCFHYLLQMRTENFTWIQQQGSFGDFCKISSWSGRRQFQKIGKEEQRIRMGARGRSGLEKEISIVYLANQTSKVKINTCLFKLLYQIPFVSWVLFCSLPPSP